VADPPGLDWRNGTAYFYVRYPTDVAKLLGKRHYKKSLRTRDRAEAKRRYHIAATEFEVHCTKARNQAGQVVSRPAIWTLPQVQKRIQQHIEETSHRFEAAFEDPNDSSNPDWREEALQEAVKLLSWFSDPAHPDTQEQISSLALELFGGIPPELSKRERELTASLLRRALVEVQRRAIAVLKSDFTRPSFDYAFAPNDAPVEASNRDHTVPVTSAHSGLTMAELVQQFRSSRNKTRLVSDKRLEKLAAADALIVAFFGSSTPISRITPQRCAEYRDVLPSVPANLRKHFPNNNLSLEEILSATKARKLRTLARNTQEPYLGTLKQMFRWANENWLIPRDPAAGLELAARDEEDEDDDKYASFSIEQLKAIFNAPLYRGCLNDGPGYSQQGPNVVRGTRFWVPLISLFTGMRLNEICQLDVADIQSENDTPYILIEKGPDKKLKNRSSARRVPIHPELKQIGFMGYVEQQRLAGHHKLFSDLKRSPKGHYSERMSRWFNEGFLTKVGIKASGVVFHSFRHSVRDALRRAEAPEHIVCAIGGWSHEKSTGKRYGSGNMAFPVEQLAPWVQQISYPELDLSHLHFDNSR